MTGFFGIAFAFAMVSCNGNAAATDTAADTTACPEQTEQCMKHCQMTCPDSVCLANNCENCTCPDSSACHQKPACKGEGNGECCKDKAAGEGCCKDKANGECKKECESKK